MELDLGGAFDASVAKVSGWIEALIRHLPEFVAALVVVVLFGLLARGIRSLVRSLMGRITSHEPLRRLVANAAYFAVLVLGVFLALGILQLDKTVTSLLAGVGILGLALGFAFQDIAENFIAGVLISIRRPFTDGDLVETNDFLGHVEDVDLRTTHVRTLTGQLVRVPNADVFSNPLTNYTQADRRRVDLSCGVSYGDDLEHARSVALEAIAGVEGRDTSKEPELFYEEFGGSSINFVVRFWIAETEQGGFLAARSDAIVRLKKAFDEAGVGIPFPIMTLDFSEVGGRRLDEPLAALGDARAD